MNTVKNSRFITMEGIDGAGKSAIIETVVSMIESAGIQVVITREPGGTEVGEALRDLVLSHDYNVVPNSEILVIFAARAQHLEEVIRPSLESGKWVLCDRFTDSTYAYQGGGRKVSFERIKVIEEWVQNGLKPDLTLLLDADIDTGRSRVRQTRAPDRIEQERRKFHKRVHNTYRIMAKAEPDRIKCIDATQPVAEVCANAQKHILEFLADNGYL